VQILSIAYRTERLYKKFREVRLDVREKRETSNYSVPGGKKYTDFVMYRDFPVISQ